MVADHGAYTLRTFGKVDQTLRRRQFDTADQRRRLDAQHGVGRVRRDRAPAPARPSVHPPSGPIAITGRRHVTVGRPARPRRAVGKHVGGGHRADRSRGATPAATAATPRPRPVRSLARWRSARSPSHRTTERSACRNTIRSIPSSVSFLHDPLGPVRLGDRRPRSSTGRGRGRRRPRHRSRARWPPAMWQRAPPSVTVGDGDRFAVAEAEHAER